MRFALRNQSKISEKYSTEILNEILDSLKSFFKDRNEIKDSECMYCENDKYPYKTLIISNIHKSSLIAFYVIEIKWDIYKLAFKEFI